ncbi:hypothetical protein [Rhodanobacter sp. MP1X3]|uniref:hypothetical protein n=1 Tax=Rhodanobacter sp. MP1X3 TaxID=2723086 RepID=UPI0016231146|nr:hypothetical protein [Rhodanobacter sp. MP1X3]MBB6241264.1 hypothetical protein [Rhodanobacter sp. MP1X3]
MLKQGLVAKGLLVVLIVAIATAACVLVVGATAKDVAGWLIPLVGTYVGAAYGASYAFKLQQGKEAAAADRAKVDALNRALMVMCLQYNEVAATWAKMRSFDRGELPRMIGLPAYQAPQFDYRQHVVDLAFLMRFDNAQLILEISIEQGRFDACLDSMQLRSKYFVKTVEPLIEQYGLRSKLLSEQLVFTAFGERIYQTLRNNTNSLYEHFATTEVSLFETIEKLHRTAKQFFPREKFFKVGRVNFMAEPTNGLEGLDLEAESRGIE